MIFFCLLFSLIIDAGAGKTVSRTFIPSVFRTFTSTASASLRQTVSEGETVTPSPTTSIAGTLSPTASLSPFLSSGGSATASDTFEPSSTVSLHHSNSVSQSASLSRSEGLLSESASISPSASLSLSLSLSLPRSASKSPSITPIPPTKTATRTITPSFSRTLEPTPTRTLSKSETNSFSDSIELPPTPSISSSESKSYSESVELPPTPSVSGTFSDTMPMTETVPATQSASLPYCLVQNYTEHYIRRRHLPPGHPYGHRMYPFALEAESADVAGGSAIVPFDRNYWLRERLWFVYENPDAYDQPGSPYYKVVHRYEQWRQEPPSHQLDPRQPVVDDELPLRVRRRLMQGDENDDNDDENPTDDEDNDELSRTTSVTPTHETAPSISITANNEDATMSSDTGEPTTMEETTATGETTRTEETTTVEETNVTELPADFNNTRYWFISPIPLVSPYVSRGDMFAIHAELLPAEDNKTNPQGFNHLINSGRLQIYGVVYNETYFALVMFPMVGYAITREETIRLYIQPPSVGYCRRDYIRNDIPERFYFATLRVTPTPERGPANLAAYFATGTQIFSAVGIPDLQWAASVGLASCSGIRLAHLATYNSLSPLFFLLGDSIRMAWAGCFACIGAVMVLQLLLVLLAKFYMKIRYLTPEMRRRIRGPRLVSRQALEQTEKAMLEEAKQEAAALSQRQREDSIPYEEMKNISFQASRTGRSASFFPVSPESGTSITIKLTSRRALTFRQLQNMEDSEDDAQAADSSHEEGDDLRRLIVPKSEPASPSTTTNEPLNDASPANTAPAPTSEECPKVEKIEKKSRKDTGMNRNERTRKAAMSEEERRAMSMAAAAADEAKKRRQRKEEREDVSLMSILSRVKRVPFHLYHHNTVKLQYWRMWTAAFAYSLFPNLTILVTYTMYHGILFFSIRMIQRGAYVFNNHEKMVDFILGIVGLLYCAWFFFVIVIFPAKFVTRWKVSVTYPGAEKLSLREAQEKRQDPNDDGDELDDAFSFHKTGTSRRAKAKKKQDMSKSMPLVVGPLFMILDEEPMKLAARKEAERALETEGIISLEAPLLPGGSDTSGTINKTDDKKADYKEINGGRLKGADGENMNTEKADEEKASGEKVEKSKGAPKAAGGKGGAKEQGHVRLHDPTKAVGLMPAVLKRMLYPSALILSVEDRRMFGSLISYSTPSSLWPLYPLFVPTVAAAGGAVEGLSLGTCKTMHGLIGGLLVLFGAHLWVKRPLLLPVNNFFTGLNAVLAGMMFIASIWTFGDGDPDAEEIPGEGAANTIILLALAIAGITIVRVLFILVTDFICDFIAYGATLQEEWFYEAPYEDWRRFYNLICRASKSKPRNSIKAPRPSPKASRGKSQIKNKLAKPSSFLPLGRSSRLHGASLHHTLPDIPSPKFKFVPLQPDSPSMGLLEDDLEDLLLQEERVKARRELLRQPLDAPFGEEDGDVVLAGAKSSSPRFGPPEPTAHLDINQPAPLIISTPEPAIVPSPAPERSVAKDLFMPALISTDTEDSLLKMTIALSSDNGRLVTSTNNDAPIELNVADSAQALNDFSLL